MDTELWNKILAFNLDAPMSEYNFSTRLAKENYWTKNFTQQAILEYKKFMYLAATSDFMVSPSEIVDVVWHQHLIFTQSYQEFGVLIGKQVQHVPSTHNKEEFIKFKQAKERTQKLYTENFKDQPTEIWEYSDMYQSLNLQKAKLKIRTVILLGIFAFVALIIPAYYLLKPLYVQINNPYFISGLIVLTFFIAIVLEYINHNKLKQLVNEFSSNSFVFNLHPLELVYSKKMQLANVVHGIVGELVDKKNIRVNKDNTIELVKKNTPTTLEEFQVNTTFASHKLTFYPVILKTLITKPIIANTANAIDAFKKYVVKSKKFGSLFYLNFAVLATLFMLVFVRFLTGIMRDK
ncbi:MAG TPA: DUF1399 domain-containing protein, partial [Bacteroidia bacterium]|nr:DUF1399 domain-containing protein [Bacteroidia bacterium]